MEWYQLDHVVANRSGCAELSDDDDIAKVVLQHGGWFAALFTAAVGWVLKKMFSSQLETLVGMFKEMRSDIGELKVSVAEIEGRLIERDHTGRNTWRGDSR